MKYALERLVIFLVAVAIVGCSSMPKSPEEWIGFTEEGQASFYADKHQNRKTASGEPYSHSRMTAAHKTMPFGSKVKVTNIRNGKTVVVRVNDRGPFVRGRIIDLSRSAFSSIGSTSQGLVDVKIEVIK